MPRGGYRRGGYYNSPQADIAAAAKKARNFSIPIPYVNPSTYEAVTMYVRHVCLGMDGNLF